MIPSQSEKPHGLHRRYNVTHADGSPTDPEAIYFVLRLDKGGKDPIHTQACRNAVRQYCRSVLKIGGIHLHGLADDLQKHCDRIEGSEPTGTHRAVDPQLEMAIEVAHTLQDRVVVSEGVSELPLVEVEWTPRSLSISLAGITLWSDTDDSNDELTFEYCWGRFTEWRDNLNKIK